MEEKIRQYLKTSKVLKFSANELANAIKVDSKKLREYLRDLKSNKRLPSYISQPDGRHWEIVNPFRKGDKDFKTLSSARGEKKSNIPCQPVVLKLKQAGFTKEQETLLNNFADISDELFDLGVITTDSFTGEIGEYVACKYFNLKKSPRVTRAVDAECNKGLRYQVKAKVVSGNKFNYKITGLYQGEYDYLVVVYFDCYYKPLRILRVPEKEISGDTFTIDNAVADRHQCNLSNLKIEEKVSVKITAFAKAYEQLEKSGVVRSRRIVGDIGEFYACQRLNLVLCGNQNQEGFDASDKQGRTFEIKTRRVYTSGRRVSETRRLNNLVGKKADYLIVVTLNRSFRCSGMWIMPMKNVENPKSAHLGIVNSTAGVSNLVPSQIDWLNTGKAFEGFK